MLPIGYNNIFYGDNRSQTGIPRVLDMYDDDYNWIFLHRTSSTFASKIFHRTSIVYSPSSLNKFANGNNLFRVDMVVVDSSSDILSKLREYIKVPIIIVTNKITEFNIKDYDNIYEFGYESFQPVTGRHYVSSKAFHGTSNKYFVKLGSEEVDIDDIKTAFIRDRKIDGLLG